MAYPKNIKNVKNENCRKHVFFEGFKQNGLQIRVQRIFLHIARKNPPRIAARSAAAESERVVQLCQSAKVLVAQRASLALCHD